MNYWTSVSIELANRSNYLDELYKVYPITPNPRRSISAEAVNSVKIAFENRQAEELIRELLKLELFPVKDSYLSYLRRYPDAIRYNPDTVNRIAGNLYQMGLDSIFERCTEPKETNRQMGPMFKNWLKTGALDCGICEEEYVFLNAAENCIFLSSDKRMKDFAAAHLGYTRINKGLDFIAKFNGKYVIAETKFLTDFGGHQNDQFEDAVSTLMSGINPACGRQVIKIAIIDGVLYIKSKNKLYSFLEEHSELTILSALVLKDFLYSL